MKKRVFILAAYLTLLIPMHAHATTGCTLIVSFPDNRVLKEDGDCDQRRSPMSSFKVPLAVMGFDSGILQDGETPLWPYRDEYRSDMESQKKATNPTIWLKDSIVWFSQKLTRQMGARTFEAYVKAFNYGNMDVSGNPGKNDGLTQAWLLSSLQISPKEQVAFVQKLLRKELKASAEAQTKTMQIMPEFSQGEWKAFGKTGSGWQRDGAGNIDRSKPLGWFIGWAENGKRKIVFAKLLMEDQESKEYAGPKAREQFLNELAGM